MKCYDKYLINNGDRSLVSKNITRLKYILPTILLDLITFPLQVDSREDLFI